AVLLALTDVSLPLVGRVGEGVIPSPLADSSLPLVGRGGEGVLTPREREIASLVAAGLSNRQIGLRLKISERTADAHVEHLRTKLDVHSRAQIAAWATQTGLPVAITAS